jgi:aerobic C4-dicarboxylate transport protein
MDNPGQVDVDALMEQQHGDGDVTEREPVGAGTR